MGDDIAVLFTDLAGAYPKLLASTERAFTDAYLEVAGRRSAEIARKVWQVWQRALIQGLWFSDALSSALAVASTEHRRSGLLLRRNEATLRRAVVHADRAARGSLR